MTLRTGVLVLPLRDPTVLAKVTATLQRASGGRLALGVEAGGGRGGGRWAWQRVRRRALGVAGAGGGGGVV